jgi:hypothetical protein
MQTYLGNYRTLIEKVSGKKLAVPKPRRRRAA